MFSRRVCLAVRLERAGFIPGCVCFVCLCDSHARTQRKFVLFADVLLVGLGGGEDKDVPAAPYWDQAGVRR